MMSKYSVIPQDPGAYASHGQYSHRIQWYVIFHHKDKLTNDLKILLREMTNPNLKPKSSSWPTEDGVNKVEGNGTIWDAVLDRQTNDRTYNYHVDGITSPENLTAAFTGQRGDVAIALDNRSSTSSNGRFRGLKELSDIVTERYDQTKNPANDKAERHRERAVNAGLEELDLGLNDPKSGSKIPNNVYLPLKQLPM